MKHIFDPKIIGPRYQAYHGHCAELLIDGKIVFGEKNIVRYQDSIHGDIHFNAENEWSTDVGSISGKVGKSDSPMLKKQRKFSNTDPINIYGVAIHEIGHSLGLRHSSNQTSLMYKQYGPNTPALSWNPKNNPTLPEIDKKHILEKYGHPKPWYQQTRNVIFLGMVGGFILVFVVYWIFRRCFRVIPINDRFKTVRGFFRSFSDVEDSIRVKDVESGRSNVYD